MIIRKEEYEWIITNTVECLSCAWLARTWQLLINYSCLHFLHREVLTKRLRNLIYEGAGLQTHICPNPEPVDLITYYIRGSFSIEGEDQVPWFRMQCPNSPTSSPHYSQPPTTCFKSFPLHSTGIYASVPVRKGFSEAHFPVKMPFFLIMNLNFKVFKF